MCTEEMTSPGLIHYDTIGVTSNPCKVTLPLYTSTTTRVRRIRLRVAKAVNRVMPSKRYILQLPLFPRLAEFLHVMLLAPGPPSATTSSSLHYLQKVLFLLLSSNRSRSRQDLDLDLDVPRFNCFFPGDRINDDDHARVLFQNALQATSQLACLSGMDAGISTTGLRVAGVPIGNDEWVQQFV